MVPHGFLGSFGFLWVPQDSLGFLRVPNGFLGFLCFSMFLGFPRDTSSSSMCKLSICCLIWLLRLKGLQSCFYL